jgi:hypothetical protein
LQASGFASPFYVALYLLAATLCLGRAVWRMHVNNYAAFLRSWALMPCTSPLPCPPHR